MLAKESNTMKKSNLVIWDVECAPLKRLKMRELAATIRDRYDPRKSRLIAVAKNIAPVKLPELGEQGFDVDYVPSDGNSDQRIYDRVIEEMSSNDHLEKVVLISGDRDFVRLGMICHGQDIDFEVITTSEISTSHELVDIATKHITSYDLLNQPSY